jgi:hypothetical protein
MYEFDYAGRTRRFQNVLAAKGVGCGIVTIGCERPLSERGSGVRRRALNTRSRGD